MTAIYKEFVARDVCRDCTYIGTTDYPKEFSTRGTMVDIYECTQFNGFRWLIVQSDEGGDYSSIPAEVVGNYPIIDWLKEVTQSMKSKEVAQ
jgi:hypothetical protein